MSPLTRDTADTPGCRRCTSFCDADMTHKPGALAHYIAAECLTDGGEFLVTQIYVKPAFPYSKKLPFSPGPR